MSLLGGAFAKLSDLQSGFSTAVSCLAKSTTKCVPKFVYEGVDRKSLCIASTAFAAGIATSIGGYYLWKKVIQPRVVLSPQILQEENPDLYDPEYVLPSNSEWWRIVEEEEKRNPDFGKDVKIESVYRIESDSGFSTDDDDDDDERDGEEGLVVH